MGTSLSDRKRVFFEDNTGLVNRSLTDMEWVYYSTRSGLTPVVFYSVSDHKRRYLEIQTGLSNRSISDMEHVFYGQNGIVSDYEYFDQILLTNYLTNPTAKSVEPGATTLRTNGVTNPIAALSRLKYYFGLGTGAVTYSTVNDGPGGVTSFRGTWTTAPTPTGNTGAYYGASPAIDIVISPGPCTMSIMVRSSVSQRVRPQLNFWDGVANLSFIFGSTVIINANEWTRLSVSGVAPVGTLSGIVRVTVQAGAGQVEWQIGDSLDITQILVEQTDQLRDYFDGSTVDASGWDYGWSGAAHASTSVAKSLAVTTRTNLNPNPSFEVNTVGCSASGPTVFTRETTGGHIGVAFLRSTHDPTTAAAFTNIPRVAVMPSTNVCFSAWVRSSIAVTLEFTLRYDDSSNLAIGGQLSSNTPLVANVWTRVFVSGQCTAVATLASLLPYFRTATADLVLDVDEVLYEINKLTLDSYFDGSVSNSGAFTNAWTGAADNSISVQQAPKVVGEAAVISQTLPYYVNENNEYFSRWRLNTTGGVGINFNDIVGGLVANIERTAIFLVRSNNRNFTSVQPRWRTIAGVTTVVGGVVTLLMGVWTEIRFTNTPLAIDSVPGLLINAANGHQIDDTIDVKQRMLVNGNYIGPYFDGDFQGGQWLGTPHASASTKLVSRGQ